jgi:vacuolar-type H+-ATPase subunit H
MADDELGPDYLTTRGVPSSRRGYDKRVVDALLSEARDHWQTLQDKYTELRSAVEKAGGLEFLGRELGEIGRQVGEILASAQEAADGMRTRASDEAERLESESTSSAAAKIAEAEEQALELRRSAWEAGMTLLDSALEEVERAIRVGEDDALLIRAQAEKDSHRHLAGAEREASDLIRQARYEADRQLNQAREVAQQIIDRAAAPHGSETADPSTSPDPLIEARRSQVLSEIERLRLERSIDSVETVDDGSKKTAKNVRPRDEAFEPDGIDLSDVLAADVQELRSGPETIKVRVDPPAETFGTADDVGTLFEALRTDEVETVVIPEQLPTDPFELRDRLLLPVINEGVRDVKRRIVDMQNVALDGLRGAGWKPNPPEIGREFGVVLETMIQRAGSAGATAAGPLGGIPGSLSDPGDRASHLVVSMSAALAGQLDAALEEVSGPEQSAEAIGRVFRSWRNDDAERWVRSVAAAAYHDSLLSAFRSGGIDKVVALSTGAPCENCAGPDGHSWRPGREPPNGLRVPPANLGCTCTLASGG